MNSIELATKIVEQLKQIGSIDVVNNKVDADSEVEHVIDLDMVVDRTVFNVSMTVIYMLRQD